MAVIAAIPLAAPGLAKDGNGSPQPASEVRKVQDGFARCVVRRNPAAAEQYVLDVNGDEKTRSRLLSRISDGECLGRYVDARGLANAGPGIATQASMAFPPGTMQYALADALVQEKLRTTPLTGLDKVAPLVRPERSLSESYVDRLGECVVRFDPVASHSLLMAKPESSRETEGFAAIGSALANCVEAGRALKMNKMVVRGTVALNYYRLAKAPKTLAPAAIATNPAQ